MKARAHEHSKIADLARILKVHRVAAVGLMEMLWHWTATEVPDGGIGKREDLSIANASWWPWPKRAGEYVAALRTVGLLDEVEGCRLYVHDWHEHCEDSVHKRLARQGKTFANGLPPKMTGLSDDEKERALSAFRPPLAAYAVKNGGLCGEKRRPTAANGGLPMPMPMPMPVATPPIPPVEEEQGSPEGDEAHRILRGRPELATLTYEQDLAARKDVLGGYPDYDFQAAAPKIAHRALKMGTIAHPGAWLSKQYLGLAERYGRKTEKNAGPDFFHGFST